MQVESRAWDLDKANRLGGVISLAGKRWSAAAIVLFLLMTLLAFWQRGKTGM
jgi:hypothetical protein